MPKPLDFRKIPLSEVALVGTEMISEKLLYLERKYPQNAPYMALCEFHDQPDSDEGLQLQAVPVKFFLATPPPAGLTAAPAFVRALERIRGGPSTPGMRFFIIVRASDATEDFFLLGEVSLGPIDTASN